MSDFMLRDTVEKLGIQLRNGLNAQAKALGEQAGALNENGVHGRRLAWAQHIQGLRALALGGAITVVNAHPIEGALFTDLAEIFDVADQFFEYMTKDDVVPAPTEPEPTE